jgi:hypothetical protein
MYQVLPVDIRKAAYGVAIPEGTAADEQIAALIAKAEVRLNAALPLLASAYEAQTIDAQLVKGVVEDMVIRVVKNPMAYRSLGLDDFQAVIDSSTSSGLLYVSDDERALLSPTPRRAGVRSVRLGVHGWRLPGV